MKNTYSPEEPIAAIATSLSPAALGIIRTSGKDAINLVSKIFSRPQKLNQTATHTLLYGWIIDDESKIDEVMIGVYRAPKSFTGEDMAEIFCHGGPKGILAVYNLLLKNGFRAAEKGEFTFRAFVNGKTTLTKAEAVREIIDAKTDESLQRAANRLEGGLHEQIINVKQQLIFALASLEAQTEYPEDESTIIDNFDKSALVKIKNELQKLSDSWAFEKLYQEGARAVLCGKTNAGKSSLFNALLKEERAIVSEIHGTTRDWLESWVSFDGLPVRLFDTAGIRKTQDVIEKAGVERTRMLTQEADIILYVADICNDLTADEIDFLAHIQNIPIILILNKADICTKNKVIPQNEELKFAAVCKVSAKNQNGIQELVEAVKSALVKNDTNTNTQIGLGSERQKKAVEDALQSVSHALCAPQQGFKTDAVIQDIEDALGALAEITGEITPDDILDSVFSQFCVGK